jgi:isoleucyl-tRNA synthetase
MTLYTALVTVSKVAAPMIPFMTEDIYQNLVRSIDKTAPESIHLCDFPEENEALIDRELEANMDLVLQIVVAGRACRNTANIKNRQPIGQMYVKAETELPEFYQEIVEEELNVKKMAFAQDVSAFTSYTFKPQLRTVGPKYGKLLGGIKQYLAEVDGYKAMSELKENGQISFDVNGETVVLLEEDLLIDSAQTEGYVSVSDKNVTVVLDTKLTDELIEEGFVREVISKVQTMRKEADFEVTDHIVLSMEGNDRLKSIIEKNAEDVKKDVLAEDIVFGNTDGYVKEWNINGETVTMGVKKA